MSILNTPHTSIEVTRKLKFFARVAAINVVTVLCLLAVFEVGLTMLLRFPTLALTLPAPVLRYTTALYLWSDRDDLVTFVKWDPDVTYTLMPNSTYWWVNREFDITLKTNSVGLRDEEETLTRPEILSLGDSYAMGTGVEQSKTYAKLVERMTGLKTLNMGVRSYATAREVIAASRVDTTVIKYVLLQYCENDLRENQAFVANQYQLQITPEAEYRRIGQEYRINRRYYPGKYLWLTAHTIKRDIGLTRRYRRASGTRVMTEGAIRAFHNEHAKYFLSALSQLQIQSPEFTLVVFSVYDRSSVRDRMQWQLEGRRFDDRLFIQAVAQLIAENEYPRFIEHVVLLDSASFLGTADYFVLDGHLNARGHLKLAEQLVPLLH